MLHWMLQCTCCCSQSVALATLVVGLVHCFNWMSGHISRADCKMCFFSPKVNKGYCIDTRRIEQALHRQLHIYLFYLWLCLAASPTLLRSYLSWPSTWKSVHGLNQQQRQQWRQQQQQQEQLQQEQLQRQQEQLHPLAQKQLRMTRTKQS